MRVLTPILISALFIAGGSVSVVQTRDTLQTRKIVLVTVDGLRHQELFQGIDPKLLDERAGVRNPEELRARYWRSTPEERRQALFPFFWGELALQGVVLGNRAQGSRVGLSNPHRFSYPGYAEILTGQYLEEVTSNDPIRIQRETVLDFVQRKRGLSFTDVAAFASWSVFEQIVSNRENSFFRNTGYEPVRAPWVTPKINLLSELQSRMKTPWDTVRHDAVTADLALEFIRIHEPHFIYVALGETDDWAHDERYDRVLHAIHLFDDFLRELWTLLQDLESYRDRTTLILTTDHGRGEGLEQWGRHGGDIDGAEQIWIAVIGPDTPDLGELSPSRDYLQSDVAATLLRFLGLDPQEFNPRAGEAIDLVFREAN